MSEFTYRSARSGSLVVGFALAVVIETVAIDLLLRGRHPLIAWPITISSIVTIGWLAVDYYALGRGRLRVDDDGIDLRVGRRFAIRVPLNGVATTARSTWRDVRAVGGRRSKNYLNLMNPAAPNVIVTLTGPTPVHRFGMVSRPTHLGLRLDDPAGFVDVMENARSQSEVPGS